MKTIFGLFVVLLMVFPAIADNYTYTYTGNPFNFIGCPIYINQCGAERYSVSDYVSGYFTVPTELAANLYRVDISSEITDFLWTDNHFNTFAGPGGPASLFEGWAKVSTDSQGNITDWSIAAFKGSWSTLSAVFSDTYRNPIPDDYAYIDDNTITGGVDGNPGTWTVTGGVESTVPEPSSLVLLGGVVLVAIRVIKRRSVCS